MQRKTNALIVIDLQKGFDSPDWGSRNNAACEANIERLVKAWRGAGLPLVYVHHDSSAPDSPLHPSGPGHDYKDVLPAGPDLEISKTVHSAFYGDPSLEDWLRAEGIDAVTICGITTDHCCETTARMASDLGFETFFVLDATHTFDRRHPEGHLVPADSVAEATAATLHGEFATVLSAAAAVKRLAAVARSPR